MHVKEMRKVFPGDLIDENGYKSIGIHNDRATVIGTLCNIDDLYFIKSKTNAYFPSKFDVVIGKIVYNSQDFYKVDLGTCVGTLPALSFINATKRSKPDLDKDDTVICQVERVVDGDVLLSCKVEGLGKIDECFAVASWKIRLLYFNDYLKNLSNKISFKIALGINGFVWIDGTIEAKREVLKALDNFGK